MKKKVAVLIGVCLTIDFYNALHGVTEVYNLRVSNITSERLELDATDGKKTPPTIFTSKFITRIRHGKQGNDQLLVADLANIIHSHKNWYVRADGAFGYVREKAPGTPTTKHTQSDDILLWAGYRHMISKQLHLAYTALFGIPTHQDYGLQFFQLGTGHYGLGGQMEMILKYEPHVGLAAVRYVRFLNRKTQVLLEPTCISVDFELGNLVDIIVAYYRKIHKDHAIEVGYNPTFNFSLRTRPPLDPLLPSYNIRNSWYTIYRYSFEKGGRPMSLGLSASYGFDLAPKIDALLERNMAFWISYAIKF